MHQVSKQGDRLRTRIERGIFKRQTRNGETRYEVSYTDSDGYQRWRTVTTLTEARRLRAELVTRVGSGERVAPSKVTLEKFATEWLAQQESRLRPTTHRLYSSYLAQHINPRLGKRKLSAITVDDVAALIGDMEQGWRYRERDSLLVRVQGKPFAAWTIRGVLVVLGRVLGRAARMGTINSNPVRRLEKEERPKTERRNFPNLDLAAIGTLIAKTPNRYRALVAVSVLTGVRQSVSSSRKQPRQNVTSPSRRRSDACLLRTGSRRSPKALQGRRTSSSPQRPVARSIIATSLVAAWRRRSPTGSCRSSAGTTSATSPLPHSSPKE